MSAESSTGVGKEAKWDVEGPASIVSNVTKNALRGVAEEIKVYQARRSHRLNASIPDFVQAAQPAGPATMLGEGLSAGAEFTFLAAKATGQLFKREVFRGGYDVTAGEVAALMPDQHDSAVGFTD